MLKFRHITAALIAAMISTQAWADWIRLTEVETPKEPILFMNGQKHTLQDFKGKVVVLNVFATWCGPCRHELPSLAALERTLGSQGLIVIPVTVEELSPAELNDFFATMNIKLPNAALDTTRGIQHSIASNIGIPATFLIDRSGALRYRLVGSTNWMRDDRQDHVLELLAEGKGG